MTWDIYRNLTAQMGNSSSL